MPKHHTKCSLITGAGLCRKLLVTRGGKHTCPKRPNFHANINDNLECAHLQGQLLNELPPGLSSAEFSVPNQRLTSIARTGQRFEFGISLSLYAQAKQNKKRHAPWWASWDGDDIKRKPHWNN